MRTLAMAVAAGLALSVAVPFAAGQVFTNVSTRMLERILFDMGIDYHKFEARSQQGGWTYHFQRKGFTVILEYHRGEDLTLQSRSFPPMPLERANAWNNLGKYSRVYVSSFDGLPRTFLEWNLDCTGGVTPRTIQQFMRLFETELEEFDQFMRS